MFLVTALFLNTAPTKQELENVVFQTAGIAQKYNCALKRLDYQQEPGLMSCLPLAMNFVPIKRALTTTSTAIFVPFTTQELFMAGESIYYGLNALSNNLIMADRKKLKNPNGLILGTPGSGFIRLRQNSVFIPSVFRCLSMIYYQRNPITLCFLLSSTFSPLSSKRGTWIGRSGR